MFTRKNAKHFKGLVCRTAAHNPVQPQYKELCNINNIVRRAFAGDSTVFRAARCVDLSNAPESLHEALQSQVDAKNYYDALPDAVRLAYPSPVAFFAACHDESQHDKLRSLGVAAPEVVDAPVKVEITNSTEVSADKQA